MEMYRHFARVYDVFMTRGVAYEQWAAYIDEKIKESKLVLDLACGTGNITLNLARRGYDMIGLDRSEDMLAQAQEKMYAQNLKVLWLNQDMCELDLYGTVDAAICTCDGMNYLLQPNALAEVFKRVRLFLNPNGFFIFDMNTEYKFKEVLGDEWFTDTAEGKEYVWDNQYNPKSRINKYRVRFYNAAEDLAFEEVHQQRAYDPDEVKQLLHDAGFSAVEIKDNYTNEPPKADTTRVVFICRG